MINEVNFHFRMAGYVLVVYTPSSCEKSVLKMKFLVYDYFIAKKGLIIINVLV